MHPPPKEIVVEYKRGNLRAEVQRVDSKYSPFRAVFFVGDRCFPGPAYCETEADARYKAATHVGHLFGGEHSEAQEADMMLTRDGGDPRWP